MIYNLSAPPQLWNVLTGVEITTLPNAHNDLVYELQWSPEDDALLSCSSDGTAKVREVRRQLWPMWDKRDVGDEGSGSDLHCS